MTGYEVYLKLTQCADSPRAKLAFSELPAHVRLLFSYVAEFSFQVTEGGFLAPTQDWRAQFDERELREIALDTYYAEALGGFGTNGHTERMIIANMARLLDGKPVLLKKK